MTRTMTIDGPRQAVFKTAELLENIVMNLPVKKIFGIQRVSRQFRDIMATSSAIRQKCFLQPSGEQRQTWVANSNQSIRTGPIWGWYPPHDAHFVKDSDETKITTLMKVTPARINPLLQLLSNQLSLTAATRLWGKPEELVTFTPSITWNLNNKSASWRDMQLTDPPTTSVSANVTLGTGKSRAPRTSKFWNVDERHGRGLTLGDVIDAGSKRQNASDAYVVLNGRAETLRKASLDDAVEALSGAGRKSVRIEAGVSAIGLKHMVIPSEEEWESMKKDDRTKHQIIAI